MSVEEDLQRLIERVEQVVPYVLATISYGNRLQTEKPDWVRVHKGRADSSLAQLELLLSEARALKKDGE